MGGPETRISKRWLLAFIGSDSARDSRAERGVDAEALSITRLEGSRWRGGRYGARVRILCVPCAWKVVTVGVADGGTFLDSP